MNNLDQQKFNVRRDQGCEYQEMGSLGAILEAGYHSVSSARRSPAKDPCLLFFIFMCTALPHYTRFGLYDQ